MLVQPVNSFHPKHTQRYKCSQNIASFNTLMINMLTKQLNINSASFTVIANFAFWYKKGFFKPLRSLGYTHQSFDHSQVQV